ncbi:MAG TPA: enhanced serine sensitivity protein SseB C-terminal domain-containing protein [Acidimicrobiales bacterium]|jgi:hypothetical protein|nr:enhanced serine sensitivity protein SseB C-terminal domain-containing protein [Acidimicrobiales bacterium]
MPTDGAELEAALGAAAGGGGQPVDVLRLLPQARVWVVGSRETPPAGPGEGGSVEQSLRLLLTRVGNTTILAVFTSQALLEAHAEAHQRWLALPAGDVMAGAPPGVEVVVNPGTPHSYRLDRTQVEQLARHRSPAADASSTSVAPEGDEVFLGLPAQRPDQLLDALADHLRSEPSIWRAYSAQIYRRADGRPPHPLVGIELDAGGDTPAVMESAAAVARRHSELPVDLIVADGGSLARWLTTNGEPFFDRGVTS